MIADGEGAYSGPIENLSDYIQKSGFEIPKKSSPADYIMFKL